MKIIYSQKHKLHNPSYEVYDMQQSPYAEVPERIEIIAKKLKQEKAGEFIAPKSFPISHIEKVHHKNYVEFLENKSKSLKKDDNFFASYFVTDTYAPMTKNTFIAAKESCDIALTGADFLKSGEKLIYALCRPPGHHSGAYNMGGYCYINNAAVASEYLSNSGKVAILDIDYHHGNGTQQMFYDRDDVLYISLHADPRKKYPYITGFKNEKGVADGVGYTINYPLPVDASEALYKKTLQASLKHVRRFNPLYLVISAGFDTYIKDPIAAFKLTVPFYKEIGEEIASLQLPTLVIQEGGYYVSDLGEIAWSLVKGLSSK